MIRSPHRLPPSPHLSPDHRDVATLVAVQVLLAASKLPVAKIASQELWISQINEFLDLESFNLGSTRNGRLTVLCFRFIVILKSLRAIWIRANERIRMAPRQF